MSNTLETHSWPVPSWSGSAKVIGNDVPGFSVPLQEMTKWCWAAVASGLRKIWLPTRTQCTIANNTLGKLTCCTKKSGVHPASCNVQKALADAFSYIGHLNDSFGAALDPTEIVPEIDGGCPVCLLVNAGGGGQHHVAISGYSQPIGVPAAMTLNYWDPRDGWHAGVPYGDVEAAWLYTYTTMP